MEAREVRVRKGLRRFLNAWLLLARSKRAMLGISIILSFTILAVFAPFFAPLSCGFSCDPDKDRELATFRAAPSWFSTLGIRKGLSGNFLLVDPEVGRFDSADALSEWSFRASNTTLVTPGYSSTVGHNAPGSFEAIITPRDPGTRYRTFNFTIEKSFHYPFDGPPGRFRGSAFVRLNIITTPPYSPQVLAKAFITNATHSFELWLANVAEGGALQFFFVEPDPPIDTLLGAFKDKFIRYSGGSNVIQPEKIVFPKQGDFVFSLTVEIRDSDSSSPLSGSVFIDDLNLRTYGTAFGLLGTDQLGRDLFTQLLYGARISLVVGLAAAAGGVAVGLVVGLVAGFKGGVADEFLMRSTDMLLVIPGLPLLLVLIAILTPSIWTLIGVLSLLGWMGFARVIRSQVVSLKERPFVEASRAVGAGTSHLIVKHLLPNVMGLTYVSLATGVPGAIVAEAALSFLGLFDPTLISWGRILYNAQTAGGLFNWWWILPPGIAIGVLAISFILIGYALDDILNPRLRARR